MKKNLKKRQIQAMALATIFATNQMTAFASTDIKDHWAETILTEWVEQELISGFPDGTLRPDDVVTRAQFVTMIKNALGLSNQADVDFTDVSSDDWFYEAVSTAVSYGIASGFPDGSFAPNETVTRSQAAVFGANAIGLTGGFVDRYTDAEEIPEWAVPAVGAMTEQGFLSGMPDGSFAPNDYLTRAQAVSFLERLRNYDSATLISTDSITTADTMNSEQYIVFGDDTYINNRTFDGSVLIDSSAIGQEVLFRNTVIYGNLIIEGGTSIVLENTTIHGNIIIKQNDATVQLIGSTSVNTIDIQAICTIDSSDFTGFVSQILCNTILGTSTQTKINVPADALVINQLNFVYLSESANISSITIASTGTNSKIELNAKTSIHTLTANGKITLSGSGTIGTLQANISGITYASTLTINSIVTASGVSAPTKSSSSTSLGGGGSSGSSSSSNSSSNNSSSSDSSTDSSEDSETNFTGITTAENLQKALNGESIENEYDAEDGLIILADTFTANADTFVTIAQTEVIYVSASADISQLNLVVDGEDVELELHYVAEETSIINIPSALASLTITLANWIATDIPIESVIIMGAVDHFATTNEVTSINISETAQINCVSAIGEDAEIFAVMIEADASGDLKLSEENEGIIHAITTSEDIQIQSTNAILTIPADADVVVELLGNDTIIDVIADGIVELTSKDDAILDTVTTTNHTLIIDVPVENKIIVFGVANPTIILTSGATSVPLITVEEDVTKLYVDLTKTTPTAIGQIDITTTDTIDITIEVGSISEITDTYESIIITKPENTTTLNDALITADGATNDEQKTLAPLEKLSAPSIAVIDAMEEAINGEMMFEFGTTSANITITTDVLDDIAIYYTTDDTIDLSSDLSQATLYTDSFELPLSAGGTKTIQAIVISTLTTNQAPLDSNVTSLSLSVKEADYDALDLAIVNGNQILEDEINYDNTSSLWSTFTSMLSLAEAKNFTSQSAIDQMTEYLNLSITNVSGCLLDRTSLNQAISDAELIEDVAHLYDQSNSLWTNFVSALQSAQALTNISTTQTAIDTVVINLQNAISKVEDCLLDRTNLEEAISQAEEIEAEAYLYDKSTETWLAFSTAFDVAQELLAIVTTQAEINQATNDLNDAMKDISDCLLDRTGLANAIAGAEEIEEKAYLYDESTLLFTEFITALETARILSNDKTDATQEEIDSIIRILETAPDTLNTILLTTVQLESIIAEANGKDQNVLYDADVWNAFQTALENAKAILEIVKDTTTTTTQAEIDLATNTLESTLIALEDAILNYEELEKTVESAENVIDDILSYDITNSYWTAFAEHFATAEALLSSLQQAIEEMLAITDDTTLASLNITQSTIDTATNNLKNAMGTNYATINLAKLNRSILEYVIGVADDLYADANNHDTTTILWTNFKTALDNAKIYQDTAKATTQSAIDTATETLNDAMNAIKETHITITSAIVPLADTDTVNIEFVGTKNVSVKLIAQESNVTPSVSAFAQATSHTATGDIQRVSIDIVDGDAYVFALFDNQVSSPIMITWEQLQNTIVSTIEIVATNSTTISKGDALEYDDDGYAKETTPNTDYDSGMDDTLNDPTDDGTKDDGTYEGNPFENDDTLTNGTQTVYKKVSSGSVGTTFTYEVNLLNAEGEIIPANTMVDIFGAEMNIYDQIYWSITDESILSSSDLDSKNVSLKGLKKGTTTVLVNYVDWTGKQMGMLSDFIEITIQ